MAILEVTFFQGHRNKWNVKDRDEAYVKLRNLGVDQARSWTIKETEEGLDRVTTVARSEAS